MKKILGAKTAKMTSALLPIVPLSLFKKGKHIIFSPSFSTLSCLCCLLANPSIPVLNICLALPEFALLY